MSKKDDTVIKSNNSLFNVKSKYCTNEELSDRFISDVLNITGYEVDDEGYIVDTEADPIYPEYVQCKGRLLRIISGGILHSTDIIFDPYNNITIMEELFKHYLAENHPQVVTTQIHAYDPQVKMKADLYGYLVILYSDGATITTGLHYKDTTKFLDAFMRLESRVDPVVMSDLKIYDDYEKEFFEKYKTMNPIIALEGKKK